MDDGIKKNQKRKLSAKQRKAIAYLLTGEYLQYEIADIIDVSQETLSRWKRDEDFMAELEDRMAEQDRDRRRAYRGLANKAVQRLSALINSGNGTVAMQAIKEVLKLAGDGQEEDALPENSGGVVEIPAVMMEEEMINGNNPSVAYGDSSPLEHCPKLVLGNNAHVKTSQEA